MHDFSSRSFGRWAAVNRPAVAQDRYVIGDLLKFDQAVRDVDDSDALFS